MAKINTVKEDLTLEDVDELLGGGDLDDTDFILVIGQDGILKSVFMPDVAPEEIPESLQKTLAEYGVLDLHYATGNQTLH